MASLNPIKTHVILLLICTITANTCLALQNQNNKLTIRITTISAEPALLPFPPLSSPAPTQVGVSPDIAPLFPTPVSGSSSPPSESSMPIIPSSPSPPNPDGLATPHPEFGISPTGSMQESSAFAPNLSVLLNLALLVLFYSAFW